MCFVGFYWGWGFRVPFRHVIVDSGFDELSGSPIGRLEAHTGQGSVSGNQSGWFGNKRQKEAEQGCGYTRAHGQT